MSATGGGDAILELVLAAGRARSREEWLFLLVNRSVAAAPYDRAAAWAVTGSPALLAVSGAAGAGAAAPDKNGAFAEEWKAKIHSLRGAALSSPSPVPLGEGAVWAPVPARGMGFVFERWDGAPFTDAEKKRLAGLVEACSLAWRGGGRGVRGSGRALRWGVRLAVALAVAAALAFVRLPLRIAAECEVAARNPRLVAAPMDGVIAEVLAAPGERVRAGTPLAVYDSRMMEEELNVLRRQAEVAEAELATARARGFAEQSFRAETARLEARLAQERARLRALEARYARRIITAEVDGTVQLDDPRAWRGRPVATGEAMLWLVEPSDTRLKIWLPQDDRIDFDPERPVGVHLYALGGERRAAKLTYVSTYAQPTGDGRNAFPAEAEWEDKIAPPPLGLRGTAFLYGDEVSLGYWLVRRPLGWARRRLGV